VWDGSTGTETRPRPRASRAVTGLPPHTCANCGVRLGVLVLFLVSDAMYAKHMGARRTAFGGIGGCHETPQARPLARFSLDALHVLHGEERSARGRSSSPVGAVSSERALPSCWVDRNPPPFGGLFIVEERVEASRGSETKMSSPPSPANYALEIVVISMTAQRWSGGPRSRNDCDAPGFLWKEGNGHKWPIANPTPGLMQRALWSR